MKPRLALVAAMLLLSNGLCGEVDGFNKLDELQCGALIEKCNGNKRTIMDGVKDLEEYTEGDTRYYSYYDCATDTEQQGDCPSSCIVYIW